MSNKTLVIDDAPVTRFHKKLTLYSAGGPFIDGYALTVVGIALITMAPDLGLTEVQLGAVGAASLVGVFVGGLAFGYVTDRVGRQVMYVADLLVLALASVGSALAQDAWLVVALRFVLGMAIGADYPIATSLLAEFLPRKRRGAMLGSVFVVWAAGAAVAYLVGYLLRDLGPDAWRWLLASPALFAVATLLLRLGTPESPRWLLSKGRVEEARAVVKKVYGAEYDVEHVGTETTERTSLWAVFRRPYLRRTVFTGIFWTAQVIPLFAVYTFAPQLLETFGLTGDANVYLGSLVIALLFVVGGPPGLYLIERIGRRGLLAWTFGIIVVDLLLAALVPGVGATWLFVALAVFALCSGASSFLEIVYPNELFPTNVRATAVGVGTAVSRIGSAVSTYFMPLALTAYGSTAVLVVGAAVSLAGLVATLALAPETRGMALADAASGHANEKQEEVTREHS